jgi:hypothetical protein
VGVQEQGDNIMSSSRGYMDRDDVLVLIGVTMIGIALYLQFGSPLTLAYAGAFLSVLGICLSRPKA